MVPEDFTREPAPPITLVGATSEAAAPEATAAEPPPAITRVGATPEAAAPEATAAEPPPAIRLAAATPEAVTADEAVTRYIQAGAFTKLDNARRLSATLARFGPAQMTRAVVRGREFYRVRIGPIGTREEANALLARVIAAGHPDALSVID